MKILYLGYAAERDIAETIPGMSVAGNNMQLNILEELSQYDDIDLSILTLYPMAPFPKASKIWVSKKRVKIINDLYGVRVSYLNIPIIKQFWQAMSVWKTARKMADKDTLIFTFNQFPQIGLASQWLKRKYGCRVCTLLADLPIGDAVYHKSGFFHPLRAIYESLTYGGIRNSDMIITLNQEAVQRYAPQVPYIVIEGGVRLSDVRTLQQDEKQKKNLVYGGAITQYSGIEMLAEAMRYVSDPEVVLDIYGSGPLENRIRELDSELKNVHFHGRVTNEEMLRIQREAFLLVNPRPSTDDVAMVTFPSKMFEYMLSGTPVLSTKLNGFTEGFLKHLFFFDEESIQGFARTIDRIVSCDSDELADKARGAYTFISQEKNWKVQCAQIHEFIMQRGQYRKVLFLTNIPSPYRVDFFNELGKSCDLTVLFERRESGERDKSWATIHAKNFRYEVLRGIHSSVDTAICPSVIKYVRRKYDKIFVTNFTSPTGLIAVFYMKMRHKKYALEADGGFAKDRINVKEIIKKCVISNADIYMSTSEMLDQYFMKYGAQQERIIRYPFSSFFQSQILAEPVVDKTEYRKSLGMEEKHIVLAIGSMIPRKGFDVLVQAMGKLHMEGVGCYIIGGEVPKEYENYVSSNSLNSIHFIDFQSPTKLEEYYKAADIFVHPTRYDIWGLVVGEAMAKGLPVVTTNRCVSGLELIEDGLGYIVEVDDVDGLAEKIELLLQTVDYNMNLRVLKKIRAYTIEKMSAKHLEVIEVTCE